MNGGPGWATASAAARSQRQDIVGHEARAAEHEVPGDRRLAAAGRTQERGGPAGAAHGAGVQDFVAVEHGGDRQRLGQDEPLLDIARARVLFAADPRAVGRDQVAAVVLQPHLIVLEAAIDREPRPSVVERGLKNALAGRGPGGGEVVAGEPPNPSRRGWRLPVRADRDGAGQRPVALGVESERGQPEATGASVEPGSWDMDHSACTWRSTASASSCAGVVTSAVNSRTGVTSASRP